MDIDLQFPCRLSKRGALERSLLYLYIKALKSDIFTTRGTKYVLCDTKPFLRVEPLVQAATQEPSWGCKAHFTQNNCYISSL
jgi:hypothetical protein